MVKKTITHSLTITVDGMDTPVRISDATEALAALEAYKMGKPYLTYTASTDDADYTNYLSVHQIILVQDEVTVSEQTVTDNTCVEG